MNKELENLLHEAEIARSEGQTSKELASDIRGQAAQYFGINDRSQEYIDVLSVARSIDDQNKKVWNTEYTVIGHGQVNLNDNADPENDSASISSYVVTKADLFLGDEQKQRSYGLLFMVEPNSIQAENLGGSIYWDTPISENRKSDWRYKKMSKHMASEFQDNIEK